MELMEDQIKSIAVSFANTILEGGSVWTINNHIFYQAGMAS